MGQGVISVKSEIEDRGKAGMLKALVEDRTILVYTIIVLAAVASVIVLGIDVAYSSSGNGTIVGIQNIGNRANYTVYSVTVSTPNGNFTYNLACLHLQVGNIVSYQHDLLDGYTVVGTLPDSCTG